MQHHDRFRSLATTIGPREVAALARALPWLETDEIARIALTGQPTYERSRSR